MKNTIIYWMLAAAALLFSGKGFAQKGSGNVTTKTILTEKFNSVEISGGMDVELVQGNESKVEIETDDNLTETVKATVSNGILSLSPNGGKYKASKHIVKITMNEFGYLQLTGASELTFKNALEVKDFAITLSGASELKGQVKAESLTVSSSGASNIELGGTSKKLTAAISGASDLKAGALVVEEADIKASGSSDVEIHVNKSLKADLSGASDLNYTGEPTEKSIVNTGASDVNYKGNKANDYDTTRLRLGKSNIWIFDDEGNPFAYLKMKNNGVWTGVDVGINGWATPDWKAQPEGNYSFMEVDYARSWFARWNVWEGKIPLNKKKTITLATGMGFEWNNYSFSQKIILRESNDYPGIYPTTLINVKDSSQNITRSRLQASYFSIPLLLNFRTVKRPHKQQFNFSAGVVGSVRMTSNEQHKSLDEGKTVTDRHRDDFNLAPWRATAMVRMRYSFLSVFGSYTFTSMFRKNGPELHPWTVGVSFNWF